MPHKKRELSDLWIAIAITFSISAYHIWLTFFMGANMVGAGAGRPPVFTWMSNGLYFWTIGLLWLAFRRWRSARSREREFDAMLSSGGPEAVLLVDPMRKIVHCSDAIQKIFGYSASEVMGKTTDFLYGDRRTVRGSNEIRESLNRVGFHVGEATGHASDGRQIPLEIITATMKQRRGAVLMVQDISERKESERRLHEAMASVIVEKSAKEKALLALEDNYTRLKDLERTRDNLVHMIVHDMRTPLQAMLLQLDILRTDASWKMSADDRDMLDSTVGYIRQLDVMTKSVLDLSRLEEGRLPLKRRRCSLADAVRDTLAYVSVLARGRKLLMVDDPTIEYFAFDQEVIQRVLTNLLVNALKYTPESGEVRVELSRRGQEAVVKVIDTGPGVPEEYRAKIFEKFGRVESSTHERKDSSGVGLAFCKLAVECHGGTIGVDSQGGRGSTFWFTLPFTIVQLASEPDAAPAAKAVSA